MNLLMKYFTVTFITFATLSATASDVVGVDTLMSAPQKYKGKIKVEGAVARLITDKKMIVLLDRKEWEECGEGAESCSKFKLPVQYSGMLPNVKDEGVFEGEIKKPDGRFLFVATTFKKYPPRKEAKPKE